MELQSGAMKGEERSEEETAKRLKQARECQRRKHHKLGLQDQQKGVGY